MLVGRKESMQFFALRDLLTIAMKKEKAKGFQLNQSDHISAAREAATLAFGIKEEQ